MNNPFADLLNLFYPNLCFVCGEPLMKNESQICLSCLRNIPRTDFHLIPDNPIEKKFWGKVPVFRATSFFYFQKGSPFQKLIHELKYKGNKEIGEVMGKYAAAELISSNDFSQIDIIIPIPLHPKKLAKRGYNQSECIGKGIAEIFGKPLDITSLIRIKENTTQTKKGVFERFENTEGIFDLIDKEVIENKHILLVDDVLTTGSTLEAAIAVLVSIPNVKVSVFTLAVA